MEAPLWAVTEDGRSSAPTGSLLAPAPERVIDSSALARRQLSVTQKIGDQPGLCPEIRKPARTRPLVKLTI